MFYDKITPKGKEYFMRKLLLLPICIGLFFADFGAFAANARGGRGTANTANDNTASASVAARAAVRGANKTNATKTSSTVSARAAKKSTGKINVATVSKSTSASVGMVSPNRIGNVSAGDPIMGPVALGDPIMGNATARAGAKQKVINMGTKVTAATENTTVSKECQDLYFGCMDAFCMLDNASGGRCQCSDKVKELDDLLAEIMSMTEQSQIMATEGVERLKMGQNAEEIMARAKSAADAVSVENKQKKDEANTAKKQSLDLSAWNKSWYDDDIDEFEEISAPSDFSKKTGDALYANAAQLCNKQIPVQCKSSAAMLQMVYGQKIKSDCVAYDNSLRQQQSEASQKLISAQKALRDAALEQFQDENKYDLGGCMVEFKQCMQNDGGCGEDFSGCVADVVTLNIGRTQSLKPKKIQTGAAYVEIEPMTYDILESKKPICDSVLKHCVKVADQVWGTFLREVAATVRLAEVNAESDRRMSCVSTIANCVKKSCGSQWDEKSDNYDMCLSNPDSVNQFCSIEMEKCGDTGLTDTIMTYVQAKLNSMRVDRCTTQVKDCLEDEDVCGKDYSGCLGLSSDSILDLCPTAKLTACMTKFDESTAKEYIISIAQGLALNIDNNMMQQCQNAVTAAMIKVCGSEDDCSSVTMDPETLVNSVFKYEVCPISDTTGKQGTGACRDTAESITNEDIEREIQKGNKYQPRFFKADLARAVKLQMLPVSQTSSRSAQGEQRQAKAKQQVLFKQGETAGKEEDYIKTLAVLIDNMNENLKMVITSIENDPTVDACLNGKQFSSFNGAGGRAQARFPNLTENTRQVVAMQLYNRILNKYTERLKAIQEKRDSDAMLLVTKYAQTAKDREAACKQMAADMNMDTDAYKITATATYSDKGSQKVDIQQSGYYDWDGEYHAYTGDYASSNRATTLDTKNPTCTLTWTEWRCINWHTSKNRCEHGTDDSYRKTYIKQCDMFTGVCSENQLFFTEG